MIDNSCDQLSRLSARDWGLYQYSGGTDYNNFRHGYSSLVHSLTRDLPTDTLRTESEVKLISYCRSQPPVKVGWLSKTSTASVELMLTQKKQINAAKTSLGPSEIRWVDREAATIANLLTLAY